MSKLPERKEMKKKYESTLLYLSDKKKKKKKINNDRKSKYIGVSNYKQSEHLSNLLSEEEMRLLIRNGDVQYFVIRWRRHHVRES